MNLLLQHCSIVKIQNIETGILLKQHNRFYLFTLHYNAKLIALPSSTKQFCTFISMSSIFYFLPGTYSFAYTVYRHQLHI